MVVPVPGVGAGMEAIGAMVTAKIQADAQVKTQGIQSKFALKETEVRQTEETNRKAIDKAMREIAMAEAKYVQASTAQASVTASAGQQSVAAMDQLMQPVISATFPRKDGSSISFNLGLLHCMTILGLYQNHFGLTFSPSYRLDSSGRISSSSGLPIQHYYHQAKEIFTTQSDIYRLNGPAAVAALSGQINSGNQQGVANQNPGGGLGGPQGLG